MAKTNVWKMTSKDKDGNPHKTLMLRGPEQIAVVRQHATILLNSLRRREWQNTEVDPGYVVDTIEPAGYSDPGDEPVGEWRPPGAKPVNLPLPPDEQGNPQTVRRGRSTHE